MIVPPIDLVGAGHMIRFLGAGFILLSVVACENDTVTTQVACRSPSDIAPDGRPCGDRATAVAPTTTATTVAQNTAAPATTTQVFANCDQARAAGFANIRIGEFGFSPNLDNDNDGIACER